MSNEDYNNDEAQVEDSADLSTEDNNDESYEQDDATDEGESETTEERQPETSEQRVARLKRQLEREQKKLGIEVEKPRKQENKKEVDDTLVERLDRSDLRAEGFKDKGEQDLLIKYSRFEEMDVVEFASTTLGKTLVKEYRAKSATPSPSRRTATGTRDDVAYWADQMKKGNRPPTAEMRSKARDYLAKNK